jgi:threonine/homoserine/homoserine lactone efflux protein
MFLIDPVHLLTFTLIVLSFQVIPGPATILTITRSLTGGRRVGLATGFGIAIGDMIHTVAVALGLSAILMTSALAFSLVKYLGVAYLLFLGVSAVLQTSTVTKTPAAARISPHQAFAQAILAEVLNPKTALFFLAFLPQFAQPEHGHVTRQLLLLGAVFVVLSILVTTVIVHAASFMRRLGRGPVACNVGRARSSARSICGWG